MEKETTKHIVYKMMVVRKDQHEDREAHINAILCCQWMKDDARRTQQYDYAQDWHYAAQEGLRELINL